MRTVGCVAALLLILSLAGFAQTPPSTSSKPSIYCDQPKFDFGKIVQGKKIEHIFVIQNRGNATLNVLSVQPSCGCTTAPISQNVIEPGKTAEIKSVFDTARFEGVVHKGINVSSNDPDHAIFQLSLAGTIIKLYETLPSFIDFQRINKNSGFETQVTVRGLEGRVPAITSVTLDGDVPVDATFAKKPDTDEYIVTLKLKPNVQPRGIAGSLVIHLKDPDVPTLQIPIRGQVTGDVTFFPPQINFGTLRAKEVMARKVILTLNSPDVNVTSVTADPPIFTTKLNPRPGQIRISEVQITVSETAPAGPVKGKLKIQTTSKEQGLIEIPIEGTIVQ